MFEFISPANVDESAALLGDLFAEVRDNAGPLSGGTELPATAQVVDALRQTKVSFGNPRANLIRLTPELFAATGIELSEIRKQQIANGYAFYYLTLTVDLQPGRATKFSLLETELDFGPKGSNEPIVQMIFPTSEWHEVLRWGGALKLGLSGDLGWKAGVETPAELDDYQLPGTVKANIENANELKALVVVPEYSFSLGRAEVAASGEGNSRCWWRIEQPDLQQTQSVKFGTVIMVTRGTHSIDLTAVAGARPNMGWLAEMLQSVFDALSERLQALFAPGSSPIVIGAYEHWTIELPR